MKSYSVFVGNVGTVLRTRSLREALASFEGWVRQSIDGVGRAAGEEVVVSQDDTVLVTMAGYDPEDKQAPLRVNAYADDMVRAKIGALRAYHDQKKAARTNTKQKEA